MIESAIKVSVFRVNSFLNFLVFNDFPLLAELLRWVWGCFECDLDLDLWSLVMLT